MVIEKKGKRQFVNVKLMEIEVNPGVLCDACCLV